MNSPTREQIEALDALANSISRLCRESDCPYVNQAKVPGCACYRENELAQEEFAAALRNAWPSHRDFMLRALELEVTNDQAYAERNEVVAALARIYPSGIRRTNIEGWSADWHGCVYIDLPSGQISYHYHDSHAHLFAGLPPYTKDWDGHDKAIVHDRLRALEPGRNAELAASIAEVRRVLAIIKDTQPNWCADLTRVCNAADALAATAPRAEGEK